MPLSLPPAEPRTRWSVIYGLARADLRKHGWLATRGLLERVCDSRGYSRRLGHVALEAADRIARLDILAVRRWSRPFRADALRFLRGRHLPHAKAEAVRTWLAEHPAEAAKIRAIAARLDPIDRRAA